MTKQYIVDKYPKIFKECWEFDCPETWLPKINQLCNILTLYSKRKGTEVVQICQIKVKFGQARIYSLDVPSPTEAAWLNACEKACNKIENEKEIT